jgi:hypothetical protein
MPVYDSKVQPLMQQFMAANEAEGVAIKALLAYMQGGGNDMAQMKRLSDSMTVAHDNKMNIYAKMQQFRLDR